MHQPIQDYLESYLGNPSDRSIPREFHDHLAVCPKCCEEVRALQSQTELLRTLRNPAQPDPVAGFYARVLMRIEERTPDTFWSAFLDPAFGKRLSYGCAALVLLMGTYLVNSEPSHHLESNSGLVMQGTAGELIDDGVQPKQRDAVLVNLVSYRE